MKWVTQAPRVTDNSALFFGASLPGKKQEKTSDHFAGKEGLNILINNAGVMSGNHIPTATSGEEIMKTFNINVIGTHSVTQTFSPLLIKV